MSEHCLVCGGNHDGACDPSDFVYYQCSNCQQIQQLPLDAACFGLDNMYCGCNAVAAETWEHLSVTKAIKLMEERQ